MFELRRRLGLVVCASAVMVGALTAPAFAISVALHHSSHRAVSGSAGSSADLDWAGGATLAIAVVVVGVVVFHDLFRDRARIILGARTRSTRGLQSRPQP